jgi:glycine/D-amino acid oxidase-like deaminating enzyme
MLIDERPPLSYTSCMSTECYRNFWGDNMVMTEFMNRSIELLEERALESDNQFAMNRKGYHFLSADPAKAAEHLEAAKLGESVGIGPTNIFSGSGHGQNYSGTLSNDPENTGIDLYQGSAAVQEFLPGFVTDECISLMHVKRCGFMNAQQMGAYLLEKARDTGLCQMMSPGKLTEVLVGGNHEVTGVKVQTKEGEVEVSCASFINCAGPFVKTVNSMVPGSNELPLYTEIHSKTVLKDVDGVVPFDAPMMIWDDHVDLDWSDEVHTLLCIHSSYIIPSSYSIHSS